ncbi:hypothetical protein QEN58_09815 [Halomonas alkaliantarctica]|uniref:Uncharacterized protein n=1 Tax=Halomonas alkaliantarctica TaxID=232346 RepID=A0ABY8LGR2_9GAMM|nr:hypothetical protein [Halomonas alkaliantarctica]WGI23653.1 hypothetical protein QEN58_09815 [Halomonas alkaliantarctica]
MLSRAYERPKCPACQYRKSAAEFRDPGTGEPLPACKQCMRRQQRGGAQWMA